MNKILVIPAIALFAVVMGFGVMAPAIADHGGEIGACASEFEIWDPNTETCIPDGTCPFGVSTDGGEHCALLPGPPIGMCPRDFRITSADEKPEVDANGNDLICVKLVLLHPRLGVIQVFADDIIPA